MVVSSSEFVYSVIILPAACSMMLMKSVRRIREFINTAHRFTQDTVIVDILAVYPCAHLFVTLAGCKPCCCLAGFVSF